MDYNSYFSLTNQNTPKDDSHIFEKLKADQLVQENVGGKWNILNLGAMLIANDLRQFGVRLERKGIRFARYAGNNRTTTVTHQLDVQRGYANGFEELMSFVDSLIPKSEHIGMALRRLHPLFPVLSVRELVANALIHQDMTISGAGPTIELFTDRLEITNPGAPLIHTDRMVDFPPRTRNEALARLMRHMGMGEERGSGLDKVFIEVELCQLPAPHLRAFETAMQVVLFGPKTFTEMSTEERVRTCYWHTVLRYMEGGRMKNASLCERLGIKKRNAAQATGVIRKAMDAGLIKHADSNHPRAGYHPWWA